MISKPVRSITLTMAIIFLITFLFNMIAFVIGFFGYGFVGTDTDFFVNDPIGWAILLFEGLGALIFSILMVVFWTIDTRWKDLRYKMAFFLYHSRVKNGDKIPLQYLAKVGVCSLGEIIQTLENMISRNELKGEVDQEKGVYIHKGLTRRGMRFLVALPPASVSGLQEVKQLALKGHAWNEDYDGDIEELEEVELEELPSAQEILEKRERHKIECPHCGRMNIKEHQFCTFCGEVI